MECGCLRCCHTYFKNLQLTRCAIQVADANRDGVVDKAEWDRYAASRVGSTEALKRRETELKKLLSSNRIETPSPTANKPISPPTITASATASPTVNPTPPPSAAAVSNGAVGQASQVSLGEPDRSYGPGAPFGEKGPTCVVPVKKRPKDTPVRLSSCLVVDTPAGLVDLKINGCRDSCCAECALQLPLMNESPQAQRFRQKVLDKSTAEMMMVTIGNSVARENNFETMRSFQETMKADFPTIQWKTNLDEGITGGVSQQSMYRKIAAEKAKDFHGADVIVIQYSMFAHCEQCIFAEELLRTLLELDSQPLVILVEHIARGGFDPDIRKVEWQYYNNNATLWEEISAGERGLAAHYNLPFVSMRAAVKTLAMEQSKKKQTFLDELPHKNENSLCLAEKAVDSSSHESISASTILAKFYNDHLHFSPAGNSMAGCLLADAAKSIIKSAAPLVPGLLFTLPGPFLADTKERMGASSRSETVFISSTHHKSLFPKHLSTLTDAELTEHNEGESQRVTEEGSYIENFRFRKGGRGGKKVWLHTTVPGAVFSFVTPKPCTTVQMELYRHHELPMGAAEVSIDGKLIRTLDACCEKTCVDNGDGVKRGWYYVETLAEALENKVHTVEIKVIAKKTTQCTVLGNQFDISSIIGNTEV